MRQTFMPGSLLSGVAAYFDFEGHGTSFQREVVAGLTTFVTMSYIIAVNPAILKEAGIPPGPSMVATILAAVTGTLIMGLYANRPFAIAPYMGENAFIAFTVVKLLGYTWQTALAAVFLSGVMFVALTVGRIRQWLLDSIPVGLRYSFAAGIGLFLTFIGMNEAGIVALGVPGAPLRIGAINSPQVLMAIGCFLLISVLMLWEVPGAILLGILATAAASFIVGLAPPPARWVSAPPDLRPLLFQVDLRHALSWGFFGVLLTVFMMAFIDTLGSLIGLSARAGFLDEHGHLPQIERPMMADAIATTVAGLIGTTTSGAYIESATGISAGGRTGFTAVVTAALFAAALFFAPFITAIPAAAYSPALIVVGLHMLAPIARIDFDDYTEMIPAFAVIVLMSFTYNIGIGITGGFVLYPFFKLVTGRAREVHPGLWVLSALSLLFFIFYPYH
jgi:adenine/guanine/hypoxanthine permease